MSYEEITEAVIVADGRTALVGPEKTPWKQQTLLIRK